MQYQSGFGNQFISECLPHVILPGRNSPQKVPYGLYAEQLSGSAFAMPRSQNLRSWLYRIFPSVRHGEFQAYSQPLLQGSPFNENPLPPTQLRWNSPPTPKKSIDFIDSLFTLA